MAAFNKSTFLVLLVIVSLAAAVSKEECNEAAQVFVQDYNENAGDRYVKELDRVTGCWEVSSDVHMSLIMKTGHGYFKACLNVVVDKATHKILSYGTCRR